MRKHLNHLLLVAMLIVGSATAAFAQSTVKGQIVDAESGEPLIGAAVTVQGTTQGSVTDVDGYFIQKVAGNATLVFKYLGYKDAAKKISQKGNVDLGVVRMEPDAVMLKDVTITSSVAVARKTPIAVSTIEPTFIEERLGNQEFPELLKSTPSVYTSKEGGGYGDSEILVRGFGAANTAVMINGVPMNDMEWGGYLLVKLGRPLRRVSLCADTAWYRCFQVVFSFCGWLYQRAHQCTGDQQGGLLGIQHRQ